MRTGGPRGTVLWAAVVIGVAACLCAGCDGQMLKAFREASGEELELGVGYLLDGVVDGLFEIWTPDSSAGSDAGTG